MKGRQGNRQRGSLVHPYQFLSGHTSQHDGHKSQDAREEPSTDPKRGGGLCFYASHLTLKEKTQQNTSQTALKVSCQNPSPAGAELATFCSRRPAPRLRLRFPLGCRVARTSAEGQSLAAPPLVTSVQGAGMAAQGFPSSSCWRELPVCLMQMSPSNPEPACSGVRFIFVSLKFCFNSSFIYLNLKLLGIIFGG